MKRVIVNGDESDAYSKWRKIHVSLGRAGAVRAIKKRTHRRERRDGQRWVDEQRGDCGDE